MMKRFSSVVKKYFVVLVNISDNGKNMFCYLLTDTDRSKDLNKQMQLKKNIKLNDFGKVLFACENEIPEGIKQVMLEEYGFETK